MKAHVTASVIVFSILCGGGCGVSQGLKRSTTASWEIRKVRTRALPPVTLQFEVPQSTIRVLGSDTLQALHPIYGGLSETQYLIQLSFEQKAFEDWKRFSDLVLKDSSSCSQCLHPSSFQEVDPQSPHPGHWLQQRHEQLDVMDTEFFRYYRRDFVEAGRFVKCEVLYRKFVSQSKGIHEFVDEDDKTIRRIMSSIKVVTE
jgi:hypothetical protein